MRFIEKYGTHVIVGVKMGGKDVIHIKQQKKSLLQPVEVQKVLKKLADERFSEDVNGSFILDSKETTKKLKDTWLLTREQYPALANSIRQPIVSHLKKDDVVIIRVRQGGINNSQSHSQWLSTISQAPDAISMSFVPIISLLNGVPGSGFLSHALNLYLRYKPSIMELQQFLEFQLPRQWAPTFCEYPVGPQCKKLGSPSLWFSPLGPKLYINTTRVDAGNRPATGIRLYLEGKKSNLLAIHLQHLSSLPRILELSDGCNIEPDDHALQERQYYEPVKWSLFSHVCTAPVQYSGACIDEPASVVSKAWFEVKEVGMKKVLFLRIGFSIVGSARIRRSEWDCPANLTRKSGMISTLFSTRFSTDQIPDGKAGKLEQLNSAVFPDGPPAPTRVPRMARFVDTREMVRGPEVPPGYWVVTGAKLCVEGGKISLKVKYSLLAIMPEDDPYDVGIDIWKS